MNYIGDSTTTHPALSRVDNPDFLFRVKCDGASPAVIGWMPWGDAMDTARRLHRAKEVLSSAVIGCSRYMEYAGHYAAFLAGQISKDEFDAVSVGFCVSPGADLPDLADRIEIILRETGVAFPTEQLEEFCSATGGEIEAALRLLGERGLVAIEG